MRELFLKNLLSKDKKRRELFFCEHTEQGDCVQDVEKKTVYRIKEILEFTDLFDLELFLERKKEDITSHQTFIIRHYDSKSGCEKFIHKVAGNKYVVFKDKVIILYISKCVKKTIIHKKQSSEAFLA